MNARSITFRSSRTLPGHGKPFSISIAAAETPLTSRFISWLNRATKWAVSAGTSSACSRSGGTTIRTTLSRKKRSERNLPSATLVSRSTFVAAITRTSARSSCTPPTRRNTLFSRRRRSFACPPGGRSPISSSITEPPSALSKSPRFCAWASVNAPRSWPKSSDSRSCSGSAAQFTWKNGRSARALWKWMPRATTSLPEPLSPSRRTVVVSLWASRFVIDRTCSIAAEPPTISSWAFAPRRSAVRAPIWRRVRAVAIAFSTAASSAWNGKGFTRKSTAPCFIASTATSTVEWADIMSTAMSGWRESARWSVWTPSIPGRRTSRSMRSGGEAEMSSRACSPVSAERTS